MIVFLVRRSFESDQPLVRLAFHASSPPHPPTPQDHVKLAIELSERMEASKPSHMAAFLKVSQRTTHTTISYGMTKTYLLVGEWQPNTKHALLRGLS